MPRLRSVVVIALIWLGAFAASSAPDGLGRAARANAASLGAAPPGGSIEGKRWAVTVASAAGQWDLPIGSDGKRWD